MIELQLTDFEADTLYAVCDKRIAELDSYIEQDETIPAVVDAALHEQDQLRSVMKKLNIE